jgi:hypothetical protein
MEHQAKGTSRVLTAAIVFSALVGIFYFGYRVVRGPSVPGETNPFEYDIEDFKKIDPGLVHYAESARIPLGPGEVHAIAAGSDGRIYVAGDEAVLVFDGNGTRLKTIETDGPAMALSVDGRDALYLGMIDHVEVFDLDGTRTSPWKSLGERAVVTSIAVSGPLVFVADAGNLVVWKYDKSGLLLGKIGERDEARDVPGFIIPSPYFDVAVDPDGFLWAADTGRHSLENFNVDGGFRTSWGEPSMEIGGFSGCCNPSHFAILEDGSFVTSEKGLVRIKVYNRLGSLVSVVAGPDLFDEGTVGLDLAIEPSGRILVLDPARKSVRIFTKMKT